MAQVRSLGSSPPPIRAHVRPSQYQRRWAEWLCRLLPLLRSLLRGLLVWLLVLLLEAVLLPSNLSAIHRMSLVVFALGLVLLWACWDQWAEEWLKPESFLKSLGSHLNGRR